MATKKPKSDSNNLLQAEEEEEGANSSSRASTSKKSKKKAVVPVIEGNSLPKHCVSRCLASHMSPQFHVDEDVEKDLYHGLHHFLSTLSEDLEQQSKDHNINKISPDMLKTYLLNELHFPDELVAVAYKESQSFAATQKRRSDIRKKSQKKHSPEELERLKAMQQKLFEQSRNPFG